MISLFLLFYFYYLKIRDVPIIRAKKNGQKNKKESVRLKKKECGEKKLGEKKKKKRIRFRRRDKKRRKNFKKICPIQKKNYVTR